MIITINDNIEIEMFNPLELSFGTSEDRLPKSKLNLARLGISKERIRIKDRWFDVLSQSDLIRKRNKNDGYYRVVYIQVNFKSGEYYIGKANRPRWSDLQRYPGSGVKFSNKFKKYKEQFLRYYIAACKTAEETEELEASIVDSDLLLDEKCLNLVAGGGGTSKHPSVAESSEKKRAHMRANPEQFKPMLEASIKAFRSGDTPALRARNKRIKEVMSEEIYREMSRDRINKWKREKPREYLESRRKNHRAIKSSEVQEKRKESLRKWAQENPEKHREWQEKLIKSRTSEEANSKRKASLKEWKEKNPDEAVANSKKRARAAAAKTSKEIYMLDLLTGKVLREFPSQHAAARWLVDNGMAKNTNCVSSISSVCLRKPCSTGYGYRKKAYGYGWCFASEIKNDE
ncbi:hypothetical protein [Motiliproteus sediminis]|uniref:hypothetical protein n=1 Tax=Motiliproteus sediminis TaxID=1468178 RepID=UPI001AF028E4|nr:hypothetical protein [Motiliproteus sediminis]